MRRGLSEWLTNGDIVDILHLRDISMVTIFLAFCTHIGCTLELFLVNWHCDLIWFVICPSLAVDSSSAVDCVQHSSPKMTCYVSSGTLSPTQYTLTDENIWLMIIVQHSTVLAQFLEQLTRLLWHFVRSFRLYKLPVAGKRLTAKTIPDLLCVQYNFNRLLSVSNVFASDCFVLTFRCFAFLSWPLHLFVCRLCLHAVFTTWWSKKQIPVFIFVTILVDIQ